MAINVLIQNQNFDSGINKILVRKKSVRTNNRNKTKYEYIIRLLNERKSFCVQFDAPVKSSRSSPSAQLSTIIIF